MRVLQVHTRYRQRGGEDAVVAAEAALLRSAGHEVAELLADNSRRPGETAVQLLRAPWNTAAKAEVERLAREVRPDVAHVHNTWFALSPSVYEGLHSAGVPVVATLHNYRLMCIAGTLFRDGAPCFDCVGRSPAPGVRHRCYRGSTALSGIAAATIVVGRRRRAWHEYVDMFLAPSSFSRSLLVQGGLPEDRIAVKPHFVADPGPRPAPPSESTALLYVGRLAPGKGVDVLLEAWSRAGTTSLTLTIVGDGPLRSELERSAPPGVRFTGEVAPREVTATMKAARGLVFPSNWPEPFGMVLVEAMACGLPIVASDTGATPEVLDTEGSLLVPAGDVDRLAAAIRLLEDAALADRAGARARQHYEGRFTPATTLGLLEARYSTVTAGAAGGGASAAQHQSRARRR